MAIKVLLSEKKVNIILRRLCHQLIERHLDFSNVVLVGLQPRGTNLLKQLLILLKKEGLNSIKFGKLDTTFFRDDFRRNHQPLNARTTEMNETVEGKNVVLIDESENLKIKGEYGHFDRKNNQTIFSILIPLSNTTQKAQSA